MKKLLLIFLTTPIILFSQTEHFTCNNSNNSINKEYYHSGRVAMNEDDEQIYVINTFFHDIHNPSPTLPINESHYLESIAYLNCTFNKFNIFFKYRGFDQQPGLPNTDVVPLDNMLNIIIINGGGYSSVGNTSPVVPYTSLRGAKGVLAHEIGHTFGLKHTFQGSSGRILLPFATPISCNGDVITEGWFPNNLSWDTEHVTRDVTNANYNASTAGDYVVDTPAAYQRPNNCSQILSGPIHCEDSNNITSVYKNYIYSNEIVDEVGEPYSSDIDLLNIMSYSSPSFLLRFTTGQGIRMRETIANNPYLLDILTNISSLYEPYEVETIETISTDIHSLTDNGDGTAEVCRLKSFTLNHYFQPGFDYDFYNQSNIVFNHHVDKIDLYGILDTGVLRYVKINQVNPTYIDIIDDYIISLSDMNSGTILYEPIVCMRPFPVCVTEQYDNGKVTSTTNLANPNTTTEVLDSQEASDPNLEQNLENDKFHIIEKTTTSGATIQKTIYKIGN